MIAPVKPPLTQPSCRDADGKPVSCPPKTTPLEYGIPGLGCLWGQSALHPHLVFEILAYSGGFQLYRWLQKRQPVSFSPFQRLALLAGCILGAVLGAKGLGWLQTPFDPLTGAFLPPGKTIVGGTFGGLAGH
jgi:hypothetical protein